mmetsp:Transcript_23754/g.70886  ORF Transcript_23754/g.70886 Transcript_23754/m.70886 type:complete len:445 (-) Transcript_23754:119-1453(-)
MSCSASMSSGSKVIHSCQVATTRGRPSASSTSLQATSSTTLPAASQGTSCGSSIAPTACTAGAATSSTRTATATTALQQVARPIADAPPPGKVTKTIVTTGKASAKPVSAPHSTSTRVITTRAAGRDAATAAVALTEMPLSGVPIKSATSSSWRSAPLRSRSTSPKRNYTPRRARASTVSADKTISSLNLSTDGLSREYWTYCSRGESRVSTYTSTATSSAAPAPSTRKGGEASVTINGQLVKRSSVRSSSPVEARAKSVECRAVFMHQGRSWKFSLSPESSVNDAISTATQQVLRNVVETDRRLGDRLSISVLPSITDTSTVGEWAHRNLDQPPLIIIKSELDDGLAQQKPELDAQNMQRLMEEQTRLLVALQKQLGEQTAIIRNQASFISELQARDRQHEQMLGASISRIEEDMASMKGQLLTLEEHLTRAGNENYGRKSKG